MDIKKFKRDYCNPTITKIAIDNEISLQLESEAPPWGPGESIGALKYNNNDPFKEQQV
jgi:hypothetical protein